MGLQSVVVVMIMDRDGVKGRLYSTIDEYTRDLQQPAHRGLVADALAGAADRSAAQLYLLCTAVISGTLGAM